MSYTLTSSLLSLSEHSELKNLASTAFVHSNSTDSIPDTDDSEDNENVQNVSEFYTDVQRSLKINGRYIIDKDGYILLDKDNNILPIGTPVTDEVKKRRFAKRLLPDDDTPLTEEELLVILNKAFPGKFGDTTHGQLVLSHYSQSILQFILAPLNASVQLHKRDFTFTENDAGIRPSEQDPYYSNIHYNKRDDETLFEIRLPHYIVVNEQLQTLKLPGGIWTFKLVEKGFQFSKAVLEDKTIFDIYVGKTPPKSLENFPAFSLINRIKHIFHTTYNPKSKGRTDVQAFLGFPDYSSRYRYLYERVESYPLGMLLTIPKNILKLLTEFAPSVVEQTAWFIIQRADRNIQNPVLKYMAVSVPAMVLGLAWSVRQITSRLTSPIRSFYKAYDVGKAIHPALGVTLGILSGLVTIAVFAAAAFGCTAGLAAVGVPHFAAAATWMASNTSVIGSSIAIAVTEIGAALTIGIGTDVAAVISGSVIASTIFAASVLLRDRFKNLLSWMYLKENHVNERHDKSLAVVDMNAAAKDAVKDKPEQTSTVDINNAILLASLALTPSKSVIEDFVTENESHRETGESTTIKNNSQTATNEISQNKETAISETSRNKESDIQPEESGLRP
jgi:hypothetical protein